jgi:hypothetical protein
MIIIFYYIIDNKEYNIEFMFQNNTENLLKIDKYEDDYYLNNEITLKNLNKLNRNQIIKFYKFIEYCTDNKINIELGF